MRSTRTMQCSVRRSLMDGEQGGAGEVDGEGAHGHGGSG